MEEAFDEGFGFSFIVFKLFVDVTVVEEAKFL